MPSYFCLQVQKEKLLVGQLNDDMKAIIQSITSSSDFEIEV